MSNRIQSGRTWRERAGRIVLDPNDAFGDPLDTPTDRRWLHRITDELGITATNDTQRQLAADLRAYLNETCEHHMRHYDAYGDDPAHDQCMWCNDIRFEDGTVADGPRVDVTA